VNFLRKAIRWKLLLLLTLCIGAPACGQVKVWQGTLEIPVYEEGLPDPNPSFDQYASTRFNYPYTLRTEITDRRVVHKLRAIYLENEYLKCSILPDIGGHVYNCTDKINGQPMFYANPSIKKARIGYRGAWAAFGVEFNFPVSHNWMSMSPVDFAYASHPDGSASLTVSNIDRVYGMEWRVELVLRPGSTVLEQRVTLSNRSDVRHRFYWWSNAGVEIWNDSHIEYPMQFTAAHGFAEVQPWPVDATGKDLSVIRNQTDGPVSVFVHGSREDFMGIWHPHTNAGTVHFASYAELPAKKIWSWGVDADALDWRKALSDNESAYAEIQGGLFRNQETYSFLQPRQQIRFTEYWMPVRNTGGISRANLSGVVHLERKSDHLLVALNVNHKISSATVRLLDERNPVFSENADLSPEKTWSKEIPVASGGHKYTFELKDGSGNLLLTQTEGQYDWTPASEIKVGLQNNYEFPDENRRTESDWLQFGKSRELEGDLLSAVDAYRKALEKFPSSYGLLKAAGRLDTGLLRFEEAVPRLAAARDRDTTDAEVSYYLALAREAAGDLRSATSAFEVALRSPEYRAAAALRLGELKARQGDLAAASHLLDQSLQVAPDDLRATEELLALQSAMGDSSAADRAREQLAHYPSSAFLLELSGKPDLQHLAADPYRVLGVASEYARLGLYRQAIEVLSRKYPSVDPDQSEPGTTAPQNNPLVAYFRGYCREKLGQSAANDFAQGARASTLYVFPSTLDDKLALEAALRANSNDANAHYFLGTWYFARAKTTDALHEWNAARATNPLLPALDASLGMALLHETSDFSAASSTFNEGIKNDPGNVSNYTGVVDALTLLGATPSERVKPLLRYPDHKKMPNPLVEELALSHAEAGNFDDAVALFHNRFFGREEGGTNVRRVWIEVRLLQTQKLAHDRNCRAALDVADRLGSPVDGLVFTKDGLGPYLNSPRANYILGEVYSACGQPDRATEKFIAASKANVALDLVWSWAASRKLPNFDSNNWNERLTSAAEKMEKLAAAERHESSSFLRAGLLCIALGQSDQAKSYLRAAILSPDTNLLHHLARLALSSDTPH
jgi:TolA-binding protein